MGFIPGRTTGWKDLGHGRCRSLAWCLTLCGWGVMKDRLVPDSVFDVALFPGGRTGLQQDRRAVATSVAAQVAVGVLNVFGVESSQQGTKIVMARPTPLLPPRILNVAEACAGLLVADDVHLRRRHGRIPLRSSALAENCHHALRDPDRDLLQRSARDGSGAAGLLCFRTAFAELCPSDGRLGHACCRHSRNESPAGRLAGGSDLHRRSRIAGEDDLRTKARKAAKRGVSCFDPGRAGGDRDGAPGRS